MSLYDDLISKPVGAAIPAPRVDSDAYTRKLEVRADIAEVELRGKTQADVDESAAAAYLRARGEDPDAWEPTGFRSSEWTMPGGGQGESARYTFRRKAGAAAAGVDLTELIDGINSWADPRNGCYVQDEVDGTHTFVVALGDMQFGKIDGDGADGTLQRTIDCINKAAIVLELYRQRFDISHVHIAWLGDHVEGFVSQGGANTFRTTLTMNEQIRLTRRVMLHAMLVFAPLVNRLTMAAVPGNHGEPQRFGGKGVTRYDDSHDTESLIAVWDAAKLNPERFGHVEFFVPETDEMTVVVDCSGTIVAHAHGHQWRPNKHFDWWKGQAFDKGSAMHQADLLLSGHLHHEHIESDGPRLFVGVPSMEQESTWYRHNTGTGGSPGLIVMVTKDGKTNVKEVVQP